MPDSGPKLMRGLLEAFILERLEAAPQHGYALLKEMEDRFGVAPNRNKIYPLLQRFEDDGLVRTIDDPDRARGKTMYELTDEGREALDDYRRVTRPFRETVSRLWGVAPAESPAAPPAPAAPREPLEPRAATAAPAAPAPARIPVTLSSAQRPAPEPGAPYPCPDARVTLSKDARSGDVSIGLTGCPMGAYDYCAKCPVYASVDGLRRLLFG